MYQKCDHFQAFPIYFGEQAGSSGRGEKWRYDIILSELWGDEDNDRKHIHLSINQLRKKIEELAGRRSLYNVAKVGSRFQVNE